MKLYAKRLLLPDGFAEDQVVTVEGGRITAIEDGTIGDLTAPVLAPGYFDLHNHGGEGYDTTLLSMELLKKFLTQQRKSGVTHILVTLLTGSLPQMAEELAFLRSAMELQKEGKLGGARIVGAHLEGPFLNAAKNGAQSADLIIPPSEDLYARYFGEYADVVKLVTVAPENDGAIALAAYLTARGIKVQAGHNTCSWERAEEAFAGGFDSVCHTFNACPAIHHRAPGLVTSALTNETVYCEAICDLVHLHEGILKLMYHCKGADRMVAISDSTMPTNLPDGTYCYAGHWCKVENGVKSTLDGALYGGGCYLDESVKNLVSIGIPAADALQMASATPAMRMGMDGLCRIEIGARANLVGLSDDYTPLFTQIEESTEIYHS